jgi:hypothetical protein
MLNLPQSDPEFTEIRISHLQAILANVRTTDNGNVHAALIKQ